MSLCPNPKCRKPLEGLGLYCWGCRRYVDDGERADTGSEQNDMLPDTRSEDERKRDARPTVEALGWTVLDFEQGFRPFECRHCGGKIAGGTRVPLGLADWLCMGHGLVAWIEWKDAKNTQKPNQIAFQDQCDAAGIPYRVCRTTEQAVRFLREVGDG